MIYTDSQLKEKIVRMIESFENEVVEFKEARTNYSFNDIGKYFSALSNEANLRGLQEAWLIFGISDDKRYVGTEFRKQGSLQSLKKEIVNGTNERLTFLEIYELTMEKCRVIAFQIPPAIRGIPTTWQGAAYAREHESISPLPMNKVDLLRSQIGMDWSKEIVEDATIEDLDEEAIKRARELFSKRQSDRKKAQEVLKKLSDIEVLNKAGITIKGKITRTALLLLGKSEAKYFFDGFIPRITWTLYNADNSVKAYEHFDIPMLMAVDKVYSRIRNVKYRYIAGQQTLFPDEVDQYEPELIKEIINNCIAHQDYRLRGKINVEEFEDRLVFINEGAFIPETIEQALEPGYKPPYYRNVFLCNAMVNLYMIDALKLHINEAMRRDERINALAILKIAGMPLIHKMYILLFNESEGDNELERINNWIYDKRCSIAHFRYGQQKNEETYVNEEILEMMLELLVGIFSNINQNMKDICSGLVKLEESTLA